MTDEQIKQLIAKTRRGIAVRIFKMSCLGWSLTITTTGILWGIGEQGLAIVLGLLQMLPATQISRGAMSSWREFSRAPAWRVWREITCHPRLFTASETENSILTRSLRDLYVHDPRGEMLPLVQATRALLIYDVQQHRLEILRKRGLALRSVRQQLVEKSARLHELGDSTLSIAAEVDEMKQEIATIEQLSTDIEASCHRLESIVLSAHRAVQVKQLHREIAELKFSVSPQSSGVAQLDSPRISDIERQITREIETFLQLERETDAHLRDL